MSDIDMTAGYSLPFDQHTTRADLSSTYSMPPDGMLQSCTLPDTPSMSYGTCSDDSDDSHSATLTPPPTSIGILAPALPWFDHQQAGKNDPSIYDYRYDQNFTSEPHGMPHEYFQHYRPPGIAQSALCSIFPTVHGFTSAHEHAPQATIQRPLLPSPMNTYQLQSRDRFNHGNSMSGIVAPQPQHYQAFAFDREEINEPSTVMNQQTAFSVTTTRMYQEVDDSASMHSFGSDNDSARGEPPYAKLIYNALMDAPDHRLVLRDIYAWISNNTDKAKDPAFTGWQNSVRHNLSMNAVGILLHGSDYVKTLTSSQGICESSLC